MSYRPAAPPNHAQAAFYAEALKPPALAVQAIVDGVDAEVAAHERLWGVGRLRLLVSDLLRAKFDAQQAKFDAAVASHSEVDTQRHGDALRRAWTALDAAARQAGHQPLPPAVWEAVGPQTGEIFTLVRTAADASQVQRPGSIVFTVADIAALLEGSPMLLEAKRVFADAAIKAAKEMPAVPPPNWITGDEIPF